MTNQEANRIIAEKLFGWHDFYEPSDHRRQSKGWQYGGIPPNETLSRIRSVPNFCASPDLCIGPGGIVEKMWERGLALIKIGTNDHICTFNDRSGRSIGNFTGFRTTLTEAIAHAAANALKGGKVKNTTTKKEMLLTQAISEVLAAALLLDRDKYADPKSPRGIFNAAVAQYVKIKEAR